MSISIVMPCYNEEGVIEEVVRTYYDKIISKISNSEFIVVDDCSKDNTNNILKRLKDEFPELKVLKTPVNSGHGKAMRLGYETAQKEWIFQVDSDNQFAAGDFWKLYAQKDNHSFILGFREKRYDPLHRLVLSKMVRFANLILFKVWIKDANCPFRLMKKEVLVDILKLVDKETLAPNIMLSVLAKKRKIAMTEIPITHYERKTGIVSIANWKLIKFALKGLKQLLKLGS